MAFELNCLLLTFPERFYWRHVELVRWRRETWIGWKDKSRWLI